MSLAKKLWILLLGVQERCVLEVGYAVESDIERRQVAFERFNGQGYPNSLKGEDIPIKLAAARQAARGSRLAENRAMTCETCIVTSEPTTALENAA